MSLLSSEPEKEHAFIQFYLTYLEKNPDDYTAKNMFALYSSLFTYFESEDIYREERDTLKNNLYTMSAQQFTTLAYIMLDPYIDILART